MVPSDKKKPRAYVEIDFKRFEKTGDIIAISKPFTDEHIVRGNFEIVYTKALVKALRMCGGAKTAILGYLLEHRDSNNTLNANNTQLATRTGISRKTVIAFLAEFIDAGYVKRDGTVLMLNPKFIVKGNKQKEAALYKKFENYGIHKKPVVKFNDQMDDENIFEEKDYE